MTEDPTASHLPQIQTLVEAFCTGEGRRSVCVWEPRSAERRVTFDASETFPPLSLGKLLLAEAAIAALDLEQMVPDHSLPETAYRNVLAAMRPRTSTVRELIALSITTSDNVAAEWLWQRLGPEAVAESCHQLGLQNTVIATGFSDSELGPALHGSSTTAADMSIVLQHLWDAREQDAGHALIWKALLNGVRNSRIPGLLPDTVPVAHKTGTLDTLSYDVGIAMTSRPFAITVLTDIDEDAYLVNRSIARLALSIARILSPRDLEDWPL